MAFYTYTGDVGDRYWPPYSSAADYEFGAAPQYSSPYELGYPNPIDYTPSAYYEDHYSERIDYTSSYNYHEYPSETSYIQPKFLQYDPPPHYHVYFPSETKFAISYSNVELPEFDEYDPTPYDGGYDQRITYGKPLPPSDLTCYPRSLPQPDSPLLENFNYNSIPSPYGRDDDIPVESPKGKKPSETIAETEIPVDNGSKVMSNGNDTDAVDEIPRGDSPYYEHQNGTVGDYADVDVSQVPYGLGLEAIDLCESMFGYWPCLAKKAQQQRNNCRVCDQERPLDPWKTAADYLFGSPVPYGYDNYQYQYHQSPYQSDQVSWLQ